MTLGQALRSQRSSNLDVLRVVLAVSVIISHAWPLALGPGTPEPLEGLTGRSLGGWAVGLFFFMSGMLITGSATRSGKTRFWTARARRILPGLSVALLATLAIALASGAVPRFSEMMIWYLRALSLVSIEHRLPGAFAGNPFPEVVNGPLWSLFYEVAAYCVCACFVWAGCAYNRWAVAALLAVAVSGALLHDLIPGRLGVFAPLFAAFAFGIAAYLYREHIQLTPSVVIVCLGLTVLLPWQLAVAPVALIMLTLIMHAPIVTLRGDTSYGLYIYGWPVSQAIVHLSPGVIPAVLAVVTVLCTIPLAYLSWHLVERPSLSARRSVL
ncbi:MAG: acyltransferase [Tateyamaria sp.]|uniref:acyltransferase family protein n=1 Tax=Tateyamaria sp. TaxID=1929288 RepID=UPI00326A6CB1